MVVAVAPNGPQALLGKRCASRHKQNPERDQATTELWGFDYAYDVNSWKEAAYPRSYWSCAFWRLRNWIWPSVWARRVCWLKRRILGYRWVFGVWNLQANYNCLHFGISLRSNQEKIFEENYIYLLTNQKTFVIFCLGKWSVPETDLQIESLKIDSLKKKNEKIFKLPLTKSKIIVIFDTSKKLNPSGLIEDWNFGITLYYLCLRMSMVRRADS